MKMLKILELAEDAAERQWEHALRDCAFIDENARLFSAEAREIVAKKERSRRRDLLEIRKMIEEQEGQE